MEFNFGDNQQVSDLSSVPEQFRSLYVPVEGQESVYKLRSEDPIVKGAVEAILGLNTALLAARGDVKRAKAGKIDLSPLADYGSDVSSIKEKIEEMKSQLADALKGKDTPPVDVEKLKAEFFKAHASELTARDKRLKSLNGQLHKVLVTNALTTAVAEAKGNADLLMPMLQSKVKAVVDDSGEMGVYVIDAAGDQRFSGVSGKEMTIPELLSEIKADSRYAGAFESEAPAGGGMLPGTSGQPTPRKMTPMTANDKIAAGLASRTKRR